jgi:hypothetical protein
VPASVGEAGAITSERHPFRQLWWGRNRNRETYHGIEADVMLIA